MLLGCSVCGSLDFLQELDDEIYCEKCVMWYDPDDHNRDRHEDEEE